MDDRFGFLRSDDKANGEASLPIPHTFEHRVEQAQGDVALDYWPPKRGVRAPPDQITLFILGNPGLLGYYPPFLNHLYSLLPAGHALISMSHNGHTPDLIAPDQPLDLPAQLDSKIEITEALRSSLDVWAAETIAAKPKLALMGHSVGAWLLCEVMKRVKSGVVDTGYMLFPTLGWLAHSWNGRTLWPIFSRPLKSLLPILAPLLAPILPFTTFPTTTLSLLRSPRTIRHVLHLSASEMEVMQDPDVDWFSQQAVNDPSRGLLGLWSGGNLDGWVGKEGPLIQDCLGGVGSGRVVILDKVPHAFCLTQQNSEAVARVVASWIVPDDRPAPDSLDVRGDGGATIASTVPM